MPESPAYPPGEEVIAAGHEPDNADVRGLAFLVAGLSLLAVVGMLVVAGMMTWRGRDVEPRLANLPPEPVSEQARIHAPLNPQQTEELRELRVREERVLASYGWVDRDAGVARIPIERAIEIASEQGLPSWPPDTQETEPEDSP